MGLGTVILDGGMRRPPLKGAGLGPLARSHTVGGQGGGAGSATEGPFGRVHYGSDGSTAAMTAQRSGGRAAKEPGDFRTERQRRMLEVLEWLLGQPGMVGATLVTRDGVCVLNTDPGLVSPETFSAMTAAMVAAAETAAYETGEGRMLRVLVETERNKMVAVGATDELLLVVVAAASLPLADLLPRVEAARQNLATVVAGV